MSLVLERASEHRDELLENWSLCRELEHPETIEPLQ
ncbi:MAG: hypothetical protein GHCLOJNM_01301 [bacterium]|nr:hypothetical protein [bacterium]